MIRRIPENQFAKVRLIPLMAFVEWSGNAKTLKMILFKKPVDLQHWISQQKNADRTGGFVPTMGALHSGHMNLIDTCRSITDFCICSIFINPVQFNDLRDFEKYPVSLEKDIEMLTKAGTDVLFLPDVQDIYPLDKTGLETYDLGPLETILEGRYRPGHFQGVCQVMSRLLTMIKPEHLFMGQKDYQQCLVIKRLIDLLHLTVQFHTVQTVREPGGLAQSSRNRRLSADQRINAAAIFRVLKELREELSFENTETVLEHAKKKLDAAHFKTDYISIARAGDLQPIQNWTGKEKAVALIAAFQGDVRLIDNMLLN